MKAKPVLVTGSHRSGTTWTGKMLAAAPHTAYIYEPLNLGSAPGLVSGLERWYPYISIENSDHYQTQIGNILSYKYSLGRNLRNIHSAREVAKIIKDQALFLFYKQNNYTPIIKDPIAFFAAEWLSKTFGMNVLIMIRHPAAFCSSLKIKNWTFNFGNFLTQPLLMERYLGKFEKAIREYAEIEKPIVLQGALLWQCIHSTVNKYQKQYPDWLFIRHEDLSRDPVNQFRRIYDAFNLKFTDQSKSVILKSSGADNPIEQQPKNEYLRNSRENIHNWKKRLTQHEISLIKAETSEISDLFYAENEW